MSKAAVAIITDATKLKSAATQIACSLDLLGQDEARKVAIAIMRDGLTVQSGAKQSCGPAKHFI